MEKEINRGITLAAQKSTTKDQDQLIHELNDRYANLPIERRTKLIGMHLRADTMAATEVTPLTTSLGSKVLSREFKKNLFDNSISKK